MVNLEMKSLQFWILATIFYREDSTCSFTVRVWLRYAACHTYKVAAVASAKEAQMLTLKWAVQTLFSRKEIKFIEWLDNQVLFISWYEITIANLVYQWITLFHVSFEGISFL